MEPFFFEISIIARKPFFPKPMYSALCAFCLGDPLQGRWNRPFNRTSAVSSIVGDFSREGMDVV